MERLAELVPSEGQAAIRNPIVQISQTTAAFNAADSQRSSEDVTPRKAQASRDVEVSMD